RRCPPTAAASAPRWTGSVTSPGTTTAPGRAAARCPARRASTTTRQPSASRERARDSPSPRPAPVTRAVACDVLVMRPIVVVEVNFKSSEGAATVHTSDHLTVSDVAARSGYTPSALRFYEREGLIHATRTTGTQRRYDRRV